MTGNEWDAETLKEVFERNPDLAVRNLPTQSQTSRHAESTASGIERPAGVSSRKTGARGTKYGAIRTEYNGVTYDSKAEAKFAADLDIQLHAGVISWWTRQVPFVVGPGITLRIDFLVVYSDETVYASPVLYEVKGVETKDWKVKLKLFKQAFPKAHLEIVK